MGGVRRGGGAGGAEGSVGQTADGEHAAAIGESGQEVGLAASPPRLTPFLDDGGITLYRGDAVEVLRGLPDGLAQTCITSPPYWNLRDYGTADWVGGDPACRHRVGGQVPDGKAPGAISAGVRPGVDAWRCLDCGARRVDAQLGLEPTPEEYVERMVDVFREVRRVLRDDGTVWLNLGDSYATNGFWPDAPSNREPTGEALTRRKPSMVERAGRAARGVGLKAKDLVGIPWMVAFALRADGWYLRSDVIWAKRNGMPESVRDRPSVAHEHVFLLSKRPRYFYDAHAILEPHAPDGRRVTGRTSQDGSHENHRLEEGERRERWPGAGRNRRSVWWVATEPFPDAHFATFPRKLIRPMILAGTSARGQCAECGAPWRRAVETSYEPHGESARSGGDFAGEREQGDLEHGRFRPQEMRHGRATRVDTTTGWAPSCGHGDAGVVAQVVLDPFIGSGTTAAVAREEGRRCVGIDLKADYLAMAGRRSQQLSLLEAWQ